MPKASPSPTSCSTNSYQTKSSALGASAALNASTAGSASPSFIPDSRLSECRTRGREQRPEEKRPPPRHARGRARRDSSQRARDRNGEHELAERQPPLA